MDIECRPLPWPKINTFEVLYFRSALYSSLLMGLPPINFVYLQTYLKNVYNGPRVTILFQLHFCRYILAASPFPCIHIYMDTGPVPNTDHVPRASRLVCFSRFGTLDYRRHDTPSRDTSGVFSARRERRCLVVNSKGDSRVVSAAQYLVQTITIASFMSITHTNSHSIRRNAASSIQKTCHETGANQTMKWGLKYLLPVRTNAVAAIHASIIAKKDLSLGVLFHHHINHHHQGSNVTNMSTNMSFYKKKLGPSCWSLVDILQMDHHTEYKSLPS